MLWKFSEFSLILRVGLILSYNWWGFNWAFLPILDEHDDEFWLAKNCEFARFNILLAYQSSILDLNFPLWPQMTSIYIVRKSEKSQGQREDRKKDGGFGFGLFYVGWVEPYSDNSPLWRVLTIGEGSNVTQYRIQHSLPNIIAALSKILNSSPFR